jgi:deazaflavin-dependent oxidoreductase (nitroreductase family)
MLGAGQPSLGPTEATDTSEERSQAMGNLERRQAPAKAPWVNRIMIRLLRSPLSRLVDGGVMLLTVTGRRTGRSYTLPVQYVWDGQVLWVYAGGSEAKSWWRNLVGGADVEVLLRRRVHSATAVAYAHADAPELVADGLGRYVDRFPASSKRLGIGSGDRFAFEQAAAHTVIVRIELKDPAELPGRTRTRHPARSADEGEAVRRFSYVYFMKNEPERVRAVAADHASYWQQLALRRYEGGPFADRSGGLITFEHDSAPEAQRLAAADPFRREKLVDSHWLKVWSVE